MPSKNINTTYRVEWMDKISIYDSVTQKTTTSATPAYYTSGTHLISVGETNHNWKQKLKVEPVLTGELFAFVTRWNVGMEKAFCKVEYVYPKPRYTRTEETVVQPNVNFNGWDRTCIDKALNIAIKSILGKYHAQTRSNQGLVSLGELRQTLALLKRPADAIARLTQAYLRRRAMLQRQINRASKKKRKLDLKKLFDRGVDEYLGLMFGILPLAGDADRAAQYMNNINERISNFVVLKSSGFNEKVISGPLTRKKNVGGYTALYSFIGKTEATVKLRGGFQATLGPSASMSTKLASSVTSAIGDARDIVPALWELLPLSFVADYFSNIGDVIDGWSFGNVFTLGLQQTTVLKGTETETGYSFIWSNHPNMTAISSWINPTAKYQHLQKEISRNRLPGLPVPTLEFEVPGFGRDARKYRNLAALVYAKGRKVRDNQSPNFWSQGVDF